MALCMLTIFLNITIKFWLTLGKKGYCTFRYDMHICILRSEDFDAAKDDNNDDDDDDDGDGGDDVMMTMTIMMMVVIMTTMTMLMMMLCHHQV